MAKLFSDSKTFVDMKLNNPPEKTLADFEALMEAKNRTPSRDDLMKFVDVSGLCSDLRAGRWQKI